MGKLTGNWLALFENIANVLLRWAEPAIRLEEVVEQLQVMETVQQLTVR